MKRETSSPRKKCIRVEEASPRIGSGELFVHSGDSLIAGHIAPMESLHGFQKCRPIIDHDECGSLYMAVDITRKQEPADRIVNKNIPGE